MSMNERIFLIDQMLADRKIVTIEQMKTRLEVSLATLKRDLAFMRDRLSAPIVFDRDLGGYILVQGQADNELPGLWFSQGEILALVTPDEVDSDSAAAMLLPGKNSMPVRCTNSA